jgi:glutamine amidotransferase
MCRFIAYLGKPIIADNLLIRPKNSLMNQSQHARESEMTVNGDGFGIGWYNTAVRKEPALFRSIRPAWNDENLRYNASMIRTHCLLAHIRAATQGSVSMENTHPFRFKEFLMMQNGGIHQFNKIKRRIIYRLDEEAFQWIEGQTDTQYIFALFMTIVKEYRTKHELQMGDLAACFTQTFAEIEDMKDEVGLDSPSLYNMVLTNGKALIATRYSTQPQVDTRTLHIASNVVPHTDEHGNLALAPSEQTDPCVLISSEILTEDPRYWENVPENHCIMVDEECNVQRVPLADV